MALSDSRPLNALPLGGGAYAEIPSHNSALLVNPRNGERYVDSKLGRVFSQANTPLGTAIPLYTATDLIGVIVIANPASSGVDLEILEYSCAWASGTSAFAAVGLMVRPLNATTLSAHATTTPFNANAFGGQASLANSSNAGQNTVSAGVAADWKRTVGNMNLEADTGTAHAVTPGIVYEPKGSLILPPGTFIYPAATKASVALFAQHFIWKEIVRA